ncbi:site-specific integrase [Mesorhizobium sp.]|uniref:tyrosine-type recombinase/integrase n=1 Tax=Mesorhizobium sp. TaxID=1871066 RepID=UPI000FE82C57|nr:site-specific integrase [Mesorhizobium sp.]RWP05069.1 MAG: site-specific integrase [Mesorhizobium sp.]
MNLNSAVLATALKDYNNGKRHSLMGVNKRGEPTAVRHADGNNLYLSVADTGSMSWVFMWTIDGVRREMGLGSFTGAGRACRLSLADARKAAEAIRVNYLAKGLNPLAAKREAKMQAKLANITFEEMAKATVDLLKGNPKKGGWKVKDGVCEQADAWLDSLYLHAPKLMGVRADEKKGVKAIAGMQVARVTDQDVFAVLKPIWAEIGVTAERVRDRIEKVIETAIGRGIYKGLNPARYPGHVQVHIGLKPSSKGKKNKQPSLAYAKVQGVIEQLLADGRMAAKASVFCTLTATRTDEARLMKWTEINWAEKLWIVPSERMKVLTENDRGGDHVVPLSDAAIALLRSIHPLVGNDYVFAGTKKGQAVGETALNDMITKNRSRGGLLALQGIATQHGMRASFRTWAKENRFDNDAAELCLAHVVGTKTQQSYDRAEMLEERTKIMRAWGDYCTGVSNVVPLQVAA